MSLSECGAQLRMCGTFTLPFVSGYLRTASRGPGFAARLTSCRLAAQLAAAARIDDMRLDAVCCCCRAENQASQQACGQVSGNSSRSPPLSGLAPLLQAVQVEAVAHAEGQLRRRHLRRRRHLVCRHGSQRLRPPPPADG